MSDRSLVVRIVGDSSSLERAFGKSSKATKNFERDFSRASRGALAATVSFRGMGRAVAFGSNAFLGGAGALFAVKSFSEAASNMVEQTSKAGQVFGASSRAVLQFARGSLGLASDQALEAASSFGALLRPMGILPDQAAKISTKLTQLGLDLSSFFNTKTADALQAITSGLVGEVEPLRRYGILLSQARVQQEALRESGKKSVRQLTQQELVQARVAIIFRDSAQAQGDFARTSGGLANQQRILSRNVRDLEISLGQALNPTIVSVTKSLNAWLSNTQNQKEITEKLHSVIADATTGIKLFKEGVEGVDKITGSFKNTLKILGVAFAVLKIRGFASSMGLLATNTKAAGLAAATSAGQFNALAAAEERAAFLGLPLGIPNVARPPASLIPNRDLRVPGGGVKLPGTFGGLGALPLAFFGSQQDLLPAPQLFLDGKSQGAFLGKPPKPGSVVKAKGKEYVITYKGGNIYAYSKDRLAKITPRVTNANQVADFFAKTKGVFGTVPEQLGPPIPTKGGGAGGGRGGLTAEQRNTFFDNAIARLLLRGGLGDINQQIAALQEADARIAARIKVTKDFTRRQNLEDELLQNQAQIKTLRGQQIAEKLQAQADARQKAIDALARKAAARNVRQFKALGLTASGDTPAASVRQLRHALGSFEKSVQGTFLDTTKTEQTVTRLRKVLGGGLGVLGRDVRLKIQDILGGLNQQLEGHTKNLSKFRHTNVNALLAGLGLDPETTRILRQRLAQIGPGGTVPGVRSAAFAGAGAQTIILKADGRELAKVVVPHQRRANQRRSESRRGPYAGRH